MRPAAILLCCLQLAALASAVKEDEQLFGWHEFLLTIDNAEAADAVREYANEKDFLTADENNLAYPERIIVPPDMASEFATFLSHRNVKFEIPLKDVGGLLMKARLENMRSARAFNYDPSTAFLQSSVIYAWIDDLVKANPSIATRKSIGKSYENRDLALLELSTDKANSKGVIFLDSAIHAREWLTPATLCYIIKELLTGYKSGKPDAVALLNKYDWQFLLVANPDGYDYTFRSSSTRFWRKTRKPYGPYYGADANRNFEYMFGGAGTSNNPASDIYHGPYAFSEVETKAMSEHLSKIQARLRRGMYLSFHTYGQYWLTPPAYTRVNPPDHAEMMRIGKIGAQAIQAAGGPVFKVGQTANIGLYEASGGAFDWVKYRLNVKYCFTLELRPESERSGGFAPSPTEIPKSGREIYAAVKAVVNAI